MEKFTPDKSDPNKIFRQHEALEDGSLNLDTLEFEKKIEAQIQFLNEQTRQVEQQISSIQDSMDEIHEGEDKRSLLRKAHDLVKNHRESFLEAAAIVGRRYILMNLIASHSIVPMINAGSEKKDEINTPNQNPAFTLAEEDQIRRNQEEYNKKIRELNQITLDSAKDNPQTTTEVTSTINPYNIDLDVDPDQRILFSELQSHGLAGDEQTTLYRQYGSDEHLGFLMDKNILYYDKQSNLWKQNDGLLAYYIDELETALPALEAHPEADKILKSQNLALEAQMPHTPEDTSDFSEYPMSIIGESAELLARKKSPYHGLRNEQAPFNEYTEKVVEQPHETIFQKDSIEIKFVESQFPDTVESYNLARVKKYIEHPLFQPHLQKLIKYSQAHDQEVVIYVVPDDYMENSSANNAMFTSEGKSVGYLPFDQDRFDFGTLNNEFTEVIFAITNPTRYKVRVEDSESELLTDLNGNQDYQLLTLVRDSILEDLKNKGQDNTTLKDIFSNEDSKADLLESLKEKYVYTKEQLNFEDSNIHKAYSNFPTLKDLVSQTHFTEGELINVFSKSVFGNSLLPIEAVMNYSGEIEFSLIDREYSDEELKSLDIPLSSLNLNPYE